MEEENPDRSTVHKLPNSPIDLEEATRRYGTDKLKQLLQLFIKDMSVRRHSIGEAMLLRQAPEVKALMHGLRGACGVIVAKPLRDRCGELEDIATRLEWNEEIDNAYSCVRTEIERLMEFTEQFLNNERGSEITDTEPGQSSEL